jgi:hypothetical protein
VHVGPERADVRSTTRMSLNTGPAEFPLLIRHDPPSDCLTAVVSTLALEIWANQAYRASLDPDLFTFYAQVMPEKSEEEMDSVFASPTGSSSPRRSLPVGEKLSHPGRSRPTSAEPVAS